jgi:hypothetical protein
MQRPYDVFYLDEQDAKSLIKKGADVKYVPFEPPLKPGDEVELQWKQHLNLSFGWWHGTVESVVPIDRDSVIRKAASPTDDDVRFCNLVDEVQIDALSIRV